MSKGTHNCSQLNTNGKSAIKSGSLVARRSQSLLDQFQKKQLSSKIQSGKQHLSNPTWHHSMPNGRVRTLQKGSADYSTQEQKAGWFETRSQLPTR